MSRVLILSNSLSGLYSFRKELVERLLIEKKEVIISVPIFLDKDITLKNYFQNKGCKLINTDINRRGINPIKDLKLIYMYIRLMKKLKPEVVLTYTIKPNIYGGISCALCKIPQLANITGLGTSIENEGLIKKVSVFLYRIALKEAKVVFFQNQSNLEFAIRNKIVKKDQCTLIPGSGVNLQNYKFLEYPYEIKTLNFLFIGRVMKSKGVEELFEAISIIKEKYKNIEFTILGGLEENYSKEIENLISKKLINYEGRQDDVSEYINRCNALINPSHHEGLSNVLLESSASGRPVLASKVPGCQETFDEGETGFGFEVKNAKSLTESIEKFIKLPYEKKKNMGAAARKKMEKEFDREIVIRSYLKTINKIVGES